MQNSIDDQLNREVLNQEFPPEDTSEFKEMTPEELTEILGLTIKEDASNKLTALLAMISVYTENSQINLSFNAPSSTGKSYIPLELSALFPAEDLIKLGGASPTAFFHEEGKYDKESNTILVDLERKIIVFLDQPSTHLLERLRALLSHDEKEIRLKITDKNQKGGNRTKNVVIKGFPVVVFCSAGLRMDEQEVTRFLLLSPEISQEKIRLAVLQKIDKDSDAAMYKQFVEGNASRTLLKNRILAIKKANVHNIKIGNPQLVKDKFLERVTVLKPRHQRDIGRLCSLIKAFALLNMWYREWEGLSLVASDTDIKYAFNLWDVLAEAQELNLPPYVLEIYKDVVLKGFEDKGSRGLERKELMQLHYKKTGRFLPGYQLRAEILPMLETAGLVFQEQDPLDKRKTLIYPVGRESGNSVEATGVQDDGDFDDLFSTLEGSFLLYNVHSLALTQSAPL